MPRLVARSYLLAPSVFLAVFLVACGGSSEPRPAPQEQAVAKPKPPDERRRFPKDGQVSMELVADRLLGKDFLPGGNLAAYERDGKNYQQFLITTKTADSAALLGLKIKTALTDAKFVPSFGGYFGRDGETPWFIFPKGKYVAGVVGLPEAEADIVARDFAARIR